MAGDHDVDRFDPEYPIPEKLGACVDEHRKLKDLATAMQKEVDRVKSRANQLKQHVIDNLSVDESGVAGRKFRGQVTTKTQPKIKEGADGWPKLFDYIADENRFDMLQKRMNSKAVLDFYEETGEWPPGVEKIIIKDLSVTKIPGR